MLTNEEIHCKIKHCEIENMQIKDTQYGEHVAELFCSKAFKKKTANTLQSYNCQY